MAEDITNRLITNRHNLKQVDEPYVNANFIINKNAGEGNCLFYSIYQYVDVDPAVLRQMLCDFYKKYENDNNYMNLSDIQKNSIFFDSDDLDNHRKKICNNGEYGSHTDLILISIILKITIIYFSYNKERKTYTIDVYCNDEECKNTNKNVVYIKYNGSNHFESMQPKTMRLPIVKIKCNVQDETDFGNKAENYTTKLNRDFSSFNNDVPKRLLLDFFTFENYWGSKNVSINYIRSQTIYEIKIYLIINSNRKDKENSRIYINVSYTPGDQIEIDITDNDSGNKFLEFKLESNINILDFLLHLLTFQTPIFI